MTEPGSRRVRLLWPTAITVPAILLLVGLGAWQLERREWKHGLIARLDERLAAPAIPWPGPGGDPARLEFRHVRLDGTFLHDREMHLAGRVRKGQAGYHVVTPLRLADGNVALVDRGWVPPARRDPATRTEGQVAGVVRVEGVLRGPGQPGPFTPANRPERNEWFTVDPPAMARQAGLDPARVGPLIVVAGPAANPGGFPVGTPVRPELTDNHLQYAVTWFSLAFVLVVVYILFVRHARQG